MSESDLVARTPQAIDLESWVRRCNLADERARRRGLNRAEVRVESLALRALLADNERLTVQNKRLQDERDARLWHHPMWSSTPGGSITDGQCVMCRQMWPCAFVRNTADQAYAERDIAVARADATEAHIARLAEDVESIYRRVVNTVDPAQSGPNVKRACLDVIRAAASVVSETGETE